MTTPLIETLAQAQKKIQALIDEHCHEFGNYDYSCDAWEFSDSAESYQAGLFDALEVVNKIHAEALRLYDAAKVREGEEVLVYDEKSKTFNVPADLMRRVWNTLDIYANPTNYRGERTGGILAGCPRAPDPTPDEMSRRAYGTLKEMQRWCWPKESNAPAHPSAQEVPEWQPIDTAKDGTRIIAYWPSDGSVEMVQWDAKFYAEVGDMPTHWMQLPNPPTTPTGGTQA
jgi:hypothetical protein